MSECRIRPIAICVFRHHDRILVGECYDSVKKGIFYRPLGGGIEFGERSEMTIKREIKEELGTDVTDLHLLGTLENLFVCDGKPGHEIVQVYDGRLEDASLYQREILHGIEDSMPLRACWKTLDEFGEGQPPLYPEGLQVFLKKMVS